MSWSILAPNVPCGDHLESELRFRNCALPRSSPKQNLTLSPLMPANRGSHGHLWDQPRSGEPGCSWAPGHMRSASAFSLPAGPCRRPRGPSCRQMILILACGQFLDDTLKWEATLFIVGRFQPLKELEPFPTLACDLRPKT